MTVNPPPVRGAVDEGICFYLAIDISEYCALHQHRWGCLLSIPVGQLQGTGSSKLIRKIGKQYLESRCHGLMGKMGVFSANSQFVLFCTASLLFDTIGEACLDYIECFLCGILTLTRFYYTILIHHSLTLSSYVPPLAQLRQ